MRTSLKVAGGILANLSLFSSQVLAYLPEITFEQPGYQPLAIVDSASPDGWESIYGNASITAAGQGFGGTGQALKLQGNPSEEAWLRKPVAWNAAEAVAFIDFRIKPAATEAGSMANFHANGTQLAFQLPSGQTKGELWVLHGNDGDAGNPPDPEQWYQTAGNFTVPSGGTASTDWLRVTLRQDFGRNLWDLFIDGKLAAVNLGFEGRGPNLQSIDLFGSTAGDTLVDNLAANPANMLFPDADKDGLPDAWETANGSNPNLYDRESIKPGTGKSFLDHYLDSLWSAGQTVNGSTGTGSIGTVPPLTVVGVHQPVGALKGSMTVGGDGSANYSVPIDVPKGTAGMEPKISLNYSSNAGNGIAGLGWSISGLQQIVRGGSTFRKDGVVDPLDFDASDRFFLDGERLVCVGGTYGAAGSVYRTEIDSFARITAVETQGSGPSSWKVETKSGLTVYFGQTPGSKVAAAGGVLTWSVNKVEDSLGNYYSVSYTNDTPVGVTSEVINQRIDKIEYTGYSGPAAAARAPYAGIYFDYELRPDQRLFYAQGVRNLFDKRLAAVRVKTGDYENHRYELKYFTSEQTGRSLLEEIIKVANGVSIPKTTFEWRTRKHTDPKWEEASVGGIKEYGGNLDSRGQISGHMTPNDAHPAIINLTGTAWRAIPYNYTITPNTMIQFGYAHTPNRPPDWAMIGLDNDLLTTAPSRLIQLVGSTGTPPSPVIYTSTHTPVPNSYQVKTLPIGSYYGLTGSQTIDGKYLILASDDNTADLSGVSQSSFYYVKVYESGTDPALVSPVSYDIKNAVPRMVDNQGDDLGVRIADFTGDGRSDILYRVMSGINETTAGNFEMELYGDGLKRSTDDQFVPTSMSSYHGLVTTFSQGGSQTPWARRARLAGLPVDINADGRMDYSYPLDIYKVNALKRGNSHSFLNYTGTSWTELPTYRLPFESQSNNAYHRFNHFEFQDLDGDSFPDLLVHMDEGSLLKNGSGILGNSQGTAWMNKVDAGLGWVRNDTYKLPKALWTAGAGDLGRRLMDLNSDGLPDYIEARSTVARDIWLNTGTGFAQQSSLSPLELPVYLTNGNGDDIGTRMLDLNGDGLTDLIKDMTFNQVNMASVHLNTGAGWKKVSDGAQTSITNDKWDLSDLTFVVFDKYYQDHPTKTSMADINADGLVDLVVANTERNTIYFNTGTTWWNSDNMPYWATGSSVDLSATTYNLPAPFFRSKAAAEQGKAVSTFADVNGDGITDYISDMDKPIPRVWVNQAAPELIDAVVDGYDARLELEYTRLNDPNNLTHSTKPAYTPLAYNQPMGAGQAQSLHGGMVVTRLKEPDGMGGHRATRRHYGDIRYDRNNETSLGFGWTEVHDEHFQAGGGYINRGYTRTENSRTYPFGGSPVAVRTYVHVTGTMAHQPSVTPGTKLVSEELSTYGLIAPITAISGGTVKRPVQIESITRTYDIDGAAGTTPGTLMTEVITSQPAANFDEHGFLLSSTIVALDGAQTTTTNIYTPVLPDAPKWHLGRLTSSTVTKAAPGKATLTKLTTFTYYSGTGLLETETVQPGDSFAVSTLYDHDIYGNVFSTVATANTTADGAPQSRWVAYEYDERGRFLISETNAIGTTANTYSHERALLLFVSDLDGRTTSYTYDQFGTRIATHHPEGTDSAEVTRFISNDQLPAGIRAVLTSHNITLKWAKSIQASGAPWSTVYYDVLGREVVKETMVLKDSTPTYADQYSVTLYDTKGRAYKISNPFLDGDPIYWTSVTYDALDRTIRKDYPDGSYDGIAMLGNATLAGQPTAYARTYNKRGNELERWEDQHGRLVQSKDPSGQTTTFSHDVEGRILQVAIGGVPQVTNTFDLVGNKVSVADLSSGTSTCIYNGFGELISATDANLQTTTTTYDSVGRPVTVTKPEGAFTTFYRSAAPAKGKAASTSGPDGYTETYSYGVQQHDYGKVIAISKRQSSAQPVYTSTTSFNALGLIISETDAGGLQVVHDYDPAFGSFKLRTRLAGARSSLLSEVTSVAHEILLAEPGFVAVPVIKTSEALPHGVVRHVYSDARSGRLMKILSTGPGGTTLQNLRYQWDPNGNLEVRKDALNNKTETFTYDNLDRVTSSALAGQSALPFSYDVKGNLTGKGSSGNRSYNDYQVSSAIVKGTPRTYSYDDVGQMLSDSKRTYTWTSFGQLREVYQMSTPALETFAATGNYAPSIPGIASGIQYIQSQARSTFEFDSTGSRAVQSMVRTFADSSEARCVTRYSGSYEIEEHATKPAGGVYANVKSVHRHQLGKACYIREDVAGPGADLIRLSVLLTDHIGSTDVIVRADWDSGSNSWNTAPTQPRAERQSYDAWGDRRSAADWSALRASDTSSRRVSAMDHDRGFTGHEMLDDFGLVHMNGRIYDPELGRFLSADPYVQIPEYSQSFNRYSYVLNNPLSYTDPSGHIIDWIVAAIWAVVKAVGAYGGFVSGAYAAGAGVAGIAGGLVAAAGAAVVGLAVPGLFLGGSIGGAMGAFVAGANIAMSVYSIGSTVAAGGDLGDVLRGVAVNFVTAAISSGFLKQFQPASGQAFAGAKATLTTIKHVAGHAILGGLSQEALGGRFQDGLLSSATSTLLMDLGISQKLGLGAPGDWSNPSKALGRTAVAGIIGGTVSAVGGGKFANGAYTAAFQHLTNEESPRKKQVMAFLVSSVAFEGNGQKVFMNGWLKAAEEVSSQMANLDSSGKGNFLKDGDTFLGVIPFSTIEEAQQIVKDRGITIAVIAGHGRVTVSYRDVITGNTKRTKREVVGKAYNFSPTNDNPWTTDFSGFGKTQMIFSSCYCGYSTFSVYAGVPKGTKYFDKDANDKGPIWGSYGPFPAKYQTLNALK